MYLHHNHSREAFTRKALKYAPASACYVLQLKKGPFLPHAVVFVSYWTDMAVILDGVCYLNVNKYSVSTTRHVNKFMLEYGGLNNVARTIPVTPDVVNTIRYYLEHYPTVQEARDYLVRHNIV